MKRISFLLGWLLISILSFGQFPSNRAPASITVRDARIQGYLNLFIPVYADTATANVNIGLDSLGALIQIRSTGNIYHRDTSAGAHKWTLIAASSPPSATWGSITGTLSAQTDLQTALNGKQAVIGTGATSQYFRGDLSLATFPTTLSFFSNDPLFISSVNSQYSIQGTGLAGSELQLVGDASGPGANKYYGTNGGGTRGWYTNASALSFISGSGTTLNGNGTIPTPYQYDFGGALTQSTHLSGSDIYDLFLDSMNSVNIVDDVGNFSSYSSQTHIFSTLGGPSGGMRHQSGELLDVFAGNTANDRISHLNMNPDSVEINFQQSGAKGGAMFRQNGLFRTKGLPNKATPGGTDSVDVVDINGYHYKIPTSAFGGGGSAIPPNGGTGFRIYSPQIPNFRSIRCTGCTLDTATTGEINITVNASNLFTRQNITTGTASTVSGGNYIVKINLGSIAATFTLTLPPSGSLSDKDIVKVESGGTLTSGTEVTSFTVVDNAGNPIIAAIAPTGIPFNVGEYMEFQWDATVARWYRHQ